MLCEQIEGIEVIRAYDNPEIFLSEVSNIEFDFCILDIEMPQVSGLQIANLLSGKPIIFATAYKEYAADAFDLNAVDYIRKPLSKERLEKAIGKVAKHVQRLAPLKNYIQLNTNKGKTFIYFNELEYVRTSDVDSRDKIARLADGTELTLKNISFERLTGMLPTKEFCRINKKELIALRIVRVFSFDEIITTLTSSTGKHISLHFSEVYHRDFLQKVNV